MSNYLLEQELELLIEVVQQLIEIEEEEFGDMLTYLM
jgi:hypothetical protein